jgi:hypothetical protein
MVPQTVTLPAMEDGYPGREEFTHEDVTDALPAQMPQAQDDPGSIYPDWNPEDSGMMRAIAGLPV